MNKIVKDAVAVPLNVINDEHISALARYIYIYLYANFSNGISVADLTKKLDGDESFVEKKVFELLKNGLVAVRSIGDEYPRKLEVKPLDAFKTVKILDSDDV